MRNNLIMVRGDTLAFDAIFYDVDSIDAAYFTVRTKADVKKVQKSIGEGITKIEDGHYRVRVAPEDTEDLDPGKYNYDFEVTLGDDVYTILIGQLTIEEDVTWREVATE